MTHLWQRVSLAALLVLVGGTVAFASLSGYVGKPDAEFRWSKQSETMVGNVKVINLKVRSQVWRGIPWDHQVQVFVPNKITYPKTALLLVTGGNPGSSDTLLGATVAPRLEAPAIILYNIPNQPLFDGKSEDDLIAHTFQEYLKSGDETWPLLFPMVKSVTRTMDAVQALSRKEWAAPVEDFMVTGASKRGWTTWLTAASDGRVRAIAPMVFDNLNFARQMPRQLELWGKYSEQIDDYSRRGLQQQMETPAGKKLVSMVDPWFYRQKLTMPKLLINGANDRYWATDATRLYWDDLAGDKYLLSIPNAGHGLQDTTRLLNSLVGFFHATAAGKEFPKLTASQMGQEGKPTLRIQSSVKPKRVLLWTAQAADLDFRPVTWMSAPMNERGGEYVAELEAPGTGGLAAFAEAEYEPEGRSYTLSTPTTVYGKRPQ
ncbi:MAG TPA: PhoPQ-activated protein PqaA family protein [Armatimonadota bacterium]|nr:PhoPQ-activated protein PqaA family protein [Armatimonadota bacterium]